MAIVLTDVKISLGDEIKRRPNDRVHLVAGFRVGKSAADVGISAHVEYK